MSRNKIELTETVFIALTNGEKMFGLLQRYPEKDHDYWYISTDDNSLIAIRDSSVIYVMRPSEKMLNTLNNAIKKTYEEIYKNEQTNTIPEKE